MTYIEGTLVSCEASSDFLCFSMSSGVISEAFSMTFGVINEAFLMASGVYNGLYSSVSSNSVSSLSASNSLLSLT